jgi:hypothetical protein
MPTPAKLVSALLFAALAYATALSIAIYALPEGQSIGQLPALMALNGLVVGWRFIGVPASGRMNRGAPMAVSVTAGLGGAVVLAVLVLLSVSFRTMIIESLDVTYTEVGEAAAAWMEFLWDYLMTVLHPVVAALFVGGAMAVGLIGGAVGRIWQ